MLEWITTVSKTRVLTDKRDRFGHVRNVGMRRWYCELYSTGETYHADTLDGGKRWVERAHAKSVSPPPIT